MTISGKILVATIILFSIISFSYFMLRAPEYDGVMSTNITLDAESEYESKNPLIKVYNPKPESLLRSPIEVNGEARGSWFLDGVFDVLVKDENGKILGEGVARALGDWVTASFVPFEGSITFEKPTTLKGDLILRKRNILKSEREEDVYSIEIVFN